MVRACCPNRKKRFFGAGAPLNDNVFLRKSLLNISVIPNEVRNLNLGNTPVTNSLFFVIPVLELQIS